MANPNKHICKLRKYKCLSIEKTKYMNIILYLIVTLKSYMTNLL